MNVRLNKRVERERGREKERVTVYRNETERYVKLWRKKSSHVSSTSGFLWSLMLWSLLLLLLPISFSFRFIRLFSFVSSFVVVDGTNGGGMYQISLQTMMNYIHSVSILTSPSNHFCIYVPIFFLLVVMMNYYRLP